MTVSPDMEIKLVLEDLIYVRYVKMENKKLLNGKSLY
jgi:hypothetical protein